jgi:hypothetical protein
VGRIALNCRIGGDRYCVKIVLVNKLLFKLFRTNKNFRIDDDGGLAVLL